MRPLNPTPPRDPEPARGRPEPGRSREGPPRTRLGYDTRSLPSALVMAGVDLWPFRRKRRAFSWESPGFVASLGGLGDLFVHLPVLSALLDRARESGAAFDLLLRSDSAFLGTALGYRVVPFENVIQDFFAGRATSGHLGRLLAGTRLLRERGYRLGIDLSGNALNAVFFALGGVGNLCSKVTRGGRPFVTHVLPEQPFENQYLLNAKLADYFDIVPDDGVFRRLQASLPCVPAPEGDWVLLSVTTACRWRSWPLRNFREVVRAFPRTTFVATGLNVEIPPGERDEAHALATEPNLDFRIDTSLPDLLSLASKARAIVTNDSAMAHVANAFGKKGAVLFGPEDSTVWSRPDGLSLLHDRTCPYYPCVQWRCAAPHAWCMEKIVPGQVVDVLGRLL
jgi:ADP-heptose:LPS heptosyltransferase